MSFPPRRCSHRRWTRRGIFFPEQIDRRGVCFYSIDLNSLREIFLHQNGRRLRDQGSAQRQISTRTGHEFATRGRIHFLVPRDFHHTLARTHQVDQHRVDCGIERAIVGRWSEGDRDGARGAKDAALCGGFNSRPDADRLTHQKNRHRGIACLSNPKGRTQPTSAPHAMLNFHGDTSDRILAASGYRSSDRSGTPETL